MNNNIIIAKQLVKMAKTLLAMSPTPNSSGKDTDYSGKVRRNVIKYGKGIKDDADQHLHDKDYTGLVLHHMHCDVHKKYISNKSISKEKAEDVVLALMLNDENNRKKVEENLKKRNKVISNESKLFTMQDCEKLQNEINEEIEDCVLIPRKFHDWFHNTLHVKPSGVGELNGKEIDLSSRELCYGIINTYIKDANLLKEIQGIRFENQSIQNAAKSILNLSLRLQNNKNQTSIINELSSVYAKLHALILQDNLASSTDESSTDESTT